MITLLGFLKKIQGYYALYAGIPMFFFRVLTGTALKPEAWELEEKDGWEPMTALEKPPFA